MIPTPPWSVRTWASITSFSLTVDLSGRYTGYIITPYTIHDNFSVDSIEVCLFRIHFFSWHLSCNLFIQKSTCFFVSSVVIGPLLRSEGFSLQFLMNLAIHAMIRIVFQNSNFCITSSSCLAGLRLLLPIPGVRL